MTWDRAHRLSVLLAGMVSIAAFCAANEDPVLAIVGLLGMPAAWRLRYSTLAEFVPRIVLNAVVLAALGHALVVAAQEGVRVESVGTLVVVLLIVKAFDRFSTRDEGHILALAVFLGIAALLTSVRLEVGVLMAAFIPVLVGAVMLHQIRLGHAQVRESWRHRATPRSTPARLAAGTGARKHFRRLLAVNVLAVVGGATVVFVMVPRGIGAGRFGDWGAAPSGSQTRFTPEVELGRGGFISTSPTVVMHVELMSGENRLGGENRVYYLRGNVLDTYDPSRGRWTRFDQGRRSPSSWSYLQPGQPIVMGQQRGSTLTQKITIVNATPGGQYIFAVLRPTTITFDRGVHVGHDFAAGRAIVRDARGELRYTVSSIEVERGRGLPEPARFESAPIRRLAEDIVSDAGVDAARIVEDPAAGAAATRAIESYLRQNYSYTLDILAAPGNVDPIEWFLFEAREGHCEYFAAAMAALCRSIGINARVITGYVAAEWNEASRHYVVRESNAHAWVECEHWEGAWRTYDATPPSDLAMQHVPRRGWLSRWRQAVDALSIAWNSSVVSFDQGTRERLIRTDRRAGGDWFVAVVNIWERFRVGGGDLALKAAVAGVTAFAAAAGLGLVLRWIVMRLSGRSRRRKGITPGQLPPWATQVGFYDRLIDVLSSRGRPKPRWQPPLEYAAGLEGSEAGLAQAVERIADLFYQARFGGRVLSDDEVAWAQTQVAEVERLAGDGVGKSPHG